MSVSRGVLEMKGVDKIRDSHEKDEQEMVEFVNV